MWASSKYEPQPDQPEKLLAEEGARGDIGLALGGDLGLDQRGEVAGCLGRSLLDHDSALAGQGHRVDQVDLLFEGRFHQPGGEAGRDQLGVLVRDLAAIGELGVLERSAVHLGMEHSQPPGQVQVEPHVLELGAIERGHVDGESDLPARQEVGQEPGGLDGDRDLGLLGRGAQMRRDHDQRMTDQGMIGRRRLGIEDVDGRAGDLAAD